MVIGCTSIRFDFIYAICSVLKACTGWVMADKNKLSGRQMQQPDRPWNVWHVSRTSRKMRNFKKKTNSQINDKKLTRNSLEFFFFFKKKMLKMFKSKSCCCGCWIIIFWAEDCHPREAGRGQMKTKWMAGSRLYLTAIHRTTQLPTEATWRDATENIYLTPREI